MAEVKKEEKKNPLQKLKEAVDDKEEQLAYLSNSNKSDRSRVVRRNFNFELR